MIHKVITSWIKEGDESSFTSAWTTIINAIAGTWGDITYKPLDGQDLDVTVNVIKSAFTAQFLLKGNVAAGGYTLKSPYTVQDVFKVTVEDITAGVVTSSTVYVVEQNGAAEPSVAITVTGNEQLITITGTARRI